MSCDVHKWLESKGGRRERVEEGSREMIILEAASEEGMCSLGKGRQRSVAGCRPGKRHSVRERPKGARRGVGKLAGKLHARWVCSGLNGELTGTDVRQVRTLGTTTRLCPGTPALCSAMQ